MHPWWEGPKTGNSLWMRENENHIILITARYQRLTPRRKIELAVATAAACVDTHRAELQQRGNIHPVWSSSNTCSAVTGSCLFKSDHAGGECTHYEMTDKCCYNAVTQTVLRGHVWFHLKRLSMYWGSRYTSPSHNNISFIDAKHAVLSSCDAGLNFLFQFLS